MNTHDIEQHAAFENWARWFALPLGRVVSGERYESMETEAASKAWQAALASPEVQALSRDAERYRFIRPGDAMVWCSSGDYPMENENLDAAIDAAMGKQK